MLVEVSGTRNGVPLPKPRTGLTVDLPDDEAAEYCAAGLARPVAVDVVELAVAPDAEKRAPARRALAKS